MNSKSLIWIFLTIGSIIGAYVPMLWGDSALSMSSIVFSSIGGIVGIWVGYKLGKSYGI